MPTGGAIGLLERGDIPRATGEIESLVSVARSALRDVAQRNPPIALSSEIYRAVNLLAAVGAETRVNIAVEPLSPATDELFAWALREGVTNVLRHSSATVCAIDIAKEEGTIRLEITNNGAMPVSSDGNGLSGLAARAAALSGSASGRPGLDGVSAAELLHEQLPSCRTLMLTGLSRPGNLLRALKAHVRGFLLKDSPAPELANAIRSVAAGGRVLNPELIAAAVETGTTPLTERLNLSPATVRNYLSIAIAKLGARNRLDAIRVAEDAGWL